MVGPLQVGFGERRGLEQVQAGEGLKIKGRVLGQVGHDDVRQELAYDVALERIVIEKDERIEADVQRLLDEPNVVGLVVPVGDKNGNILFLQHHVRMLAKRQHGGRVLVLAHHRQNDSAPFQFANERLEAEERFALIELSERDAFKAVVSDHAPPQRVVEVEDHTFRKHARGREHGVEQRLGQKRKMLETARRLRHVPHPGVEPLRPPDRRGEEIDIVQKDVLGLASFDGEPVIDLREDRADRLGDLQFVIAECSLARQHECALNDRCLAMRSECGPQILQPADCFVGEPSPVGTDVKMRLQLFA